SRGQDALALAVAVLALTPPLYVGHAAHAGEHQVATGSLVVHVVAASVWVGSLAALVLHLRGDRSVRVAAASRFSTLALACFGVLTASGGLSAVARLGTSRASWLSAYGAVLTVKIVAVVVLGAMGWAHRRWTLDLLRRGRPGAFARLAAVELLVMGATVGVAVALSRTPGPVDQANLERLGRSAGPGRVEPFSLAQLAHDWRPEPVLTTVVVLALAAYVSAARSSATALAPWPLRRFAAAVAAATVALVTLGLPTGYDDRPLLAVQVTQTLVLALVVPPLVALARPLRLVGTGGSPSSRVIRPFSGFVVLVATVGIVLQPSVRGLSVTSTPTHLVVLTAALAAGAAFVTGLLAAGTSIRQRAEVMGACAAFLAALAAVLAAAPGPGAATAAAASQLAHEQRAASVTACVAALGVAMAAALMVGRRSPRPSDLRSATA
ncbi:MAG: CopD family protein, partial [Actinomycetota bacterium]